MRAVMLCQHEFVAVTAGNGTEPADVALAKVTERRHSLSRCRRPMPWIKARNDGAPRTIFAKRCLAPAFRIAMSGQTIPLEAFSFDG
jgi:hypothetical protein